MKKIIISFLVFALIVGALVVGVVYKENIVNSADKFIETVKPDKTEENEKSDVLNEDKDIDGGFTTVDGESDNSGTSKPSGPSSF